MEYKIIIILNLLFGKIYCQILDCSKFVEFRKENEKKQAILTHAGPGLGVTKLTVYFAIPGDYYPVEDATIKLRKDVAEASRDGVEGKDIQYIIDFPKSKEEPIILRIELNNKDICVGPNISNVFKSYVQHSLINPVNATKFSDIPDPRPKGLKTFSLPVPSGPSTTQPTPSFDSPSKSTSDTNWLKSLPFSDICGKRMSEEGKTPLIINGEKTIPGEFPWAAAIFYPIRRRKVYKCTGSLISDRFVLTAAHCLANETVVYVELGRYNISDDTEYFESSYVTRNDFIIHERYRPGLANNDIALIYINPVQFTLMITPICLWSYGTVFDKFSKKGTASGWGRMEQDGQPSQILLKVQINRVDHEKCRNSNPTLRELATNNTFCAGGQLKGPCHGDSGGGFFQQNDGVWYLRGIISYSLGNKFVCQLDEYGVYVDIVYYLDWIKPHLLS